MMNAPMYARGARSYAQIGLETSVNSASPEQLIAMLYDGARRAIARAQLALSQGNIAARGQAISKAIEIVGDGLRGVLDHEAGGEVAAHLASLYNYIERCLLLANLHADADKLAEADRLLADLASAWKEMTAARAA